MKILLFLSAGAGDVINTTGVVSSLKDTYEDAQIDYLVPQRHAYILEGHPDIDRILSFEDLNLPSHCNEPGWVQKITSHFSDQYDKVVCTWSIAYYSQTKKDDSDIDFTSLTMLNLEIHGLKVDADRKAASAKLRFSQKDIDEVDKFRIKNEIVLSEKPLILMGEEVYSKWFPQFAKELKNLGYTVVGNGDYADVSIEGLNLKQIKIFFDKYCDGFLSICRGITCALYANPTSFEDKRVLIHGQKDTWDYSKYFDAPVSDKYLFTTDPLTLEMIRDIFER